MPVQPPALLRGDSEPVRLTGAMTSPQSMHAATLTFPRETAPASLADQAVALLEREQGALRWVIARYVRDAATIDDLFQEVSLKVFKRLDTVRDPAALRGWLFQLPVLIGYVGRIAVMPYRAICC
jgi:hypothetical protein